MSKIGLKYDKNVLKAISINVGRLEGWKVIILSESKVLIKNA